MLKKVFVASPLSSGMMKKFASVYGADFEQVTLGTLKNLGIFSTIRFLRSTLEMIVVLEDKESENLMDLFCLLFIFSKSKNILFIKEDISSFSLGRKHVLLAGVKNIWSTILGFYCALKIFILAQGIKFHAKNMTKVNLKIKDGKEVLYLKTNYWYGIKAGGSVAHVEGIIEGLKQHDFDVTYSSIDHSAALQPLVKKYIPLSSSRFLSPIFSLNLYIFDDHNYSELKRKNLKKYNFIYHRMALNSISGARLAQHFKIPLILEYNGSEVWVQRNWGKALFLEKISQAAEDAMLSAASYIVTISDVLKQELINRGISEEKIICYPNCVNPQKFNSDSFTTQELLKKREKLGFSSQDIILTFVGTFGKWHGVEILAHAISQLCKTESTWLKEKRVKFLFVGDGACMPEVKKILSSVPEHSHLVNLAGLVEQKQAPLYLALSDILISPHCSPNKNERFFGSPTKLFEYMAMKKVIIASDLEQIGEVLAPSININDIEMINDTFLSILCNQGDIAELAKAMKYAIDNLSTLCFMGRNARDKVLKMYTWDQHVNEILRKIQ